MDSQSDHMDPRHLERIKVVQNLYAHSFPEIQRNLPYPGNQMTEQVISHLETIDKLISDNAPKFPLDRIAKTDLAILRLAIFELVVTPEQPKKVIINEAVELAKEFGSEKSYAFVNAVLGTIVKSQPE